MTTLEDCRDRDARDPLAPLRAQFSLPPGTIYLDGNSLGAMPRATAARVADVVTQEWGRDLIQSWNTAGWFDLPRRLGDKIARLVGAGPNEVVVTDSTSINLYKVLSAALSISVEDAPARTTIVSERSNFPTDLYIAESLARQNGMALQLVEAHEIEAALTAETAILMLTHVNYRTGAMHDMQALSAAAHAAGALVVWDLAHSAGAVPVDLHAAGADFAVGCTYKYLNGGPGSPAFVWAHPRHAGRFWQPLAGWWGHNAPFAFTPGYKPAPGIGRYLCGTQPILSLAALECGLDTVLAAEPLGGMAALRAKSLALTDTFIDLVQDECRAHGVGVATPLAHAQRGSQVSLTLPASEGEGEGEGRAVSVAYSVVQALIARGVVGDFRAGDGKQHADILRFGFTPLYTSFEDVWHAARHLREVLDTAEWQRPEFAQVQAVT